MIDADVILAAGDSWSLLDRDGRTRSIAPLARLTRPALVVMSFPGAVVGQLRYEGKSSFARPMVERHVRSEGWIDGPSHVVIHSSRRLPDGAQVLFTAIPLEEWQDGTQWAARQPDHCLIVLPGQLLAERGGRRVVRHGRHLMAFAATPDGLVYEDVFAGGEAHRDLVEAAERLGRVLGDHAAVASSSGAWEWLPLDRAGVEDESELVTAMRTTSALQVELAPGAFGDQGSQVVFDALPRRLERQPLRGMAGPWPQRLAWLAEQKAPMVMALLLVLVGGLLAGGWQIGQSASETRQQIASQQAELQRLRAGLGTNGAEPDWQQLESAARFVQRLEPGIHYAPLPVIEQIRAALPDDLSIHRIGLEHARGTYRLRVDGAARNAERGRTINRFVGNLRQQGWEVRSLDPASPGRGSFSYQLVAPEDDA